MFQLCQLPGLRDWFLKHATVLAVQEPLWPVLGENACGRTSEGTKAHPANTIPSEALARGFPCSMEETLS